MKDLGEASFCIGYKTHRQVSWFVEIISKAHINRVLKMLSIDDCSHGDAPIIEKDKFSKSQCPKK